MRATFLIAGAFLILIGAGVVFYQLSESCEDNPVTSATHPYPWCSDVLDHINFTFVGILALFAGAVVLALGSSLHWILEPSKATEEAWRKPRQTYKAGSACASGKSSAGQTRWP